MKFLRIVLFAMIVAVGIASCADQHQKFLTLPEVKPDTVYVHPHCPPRHHH